MRKFVYLFLITAILWGDVHAAEEGKSDLPSDTYVELEASSNGADNSENPEDTNGSEGNGEGELGGEITENDKTEDDNTDDTDIVTEKEYELAFTGTESAYERFNIQDYAPDESEKETIYDAENIMRRDGASGAAYIIFEIPYVEEFYAVSCHRPADVAEFSFEYSKDGILWNSAEVDTETVIEDEKWTRVEYSAKGIQGVKYIKVIWGDEAESIHWWNPYFIGLYANVGESVPTELVIDTDDTAVIPMYDYSDILLEARICDQIGEETEGEIIWTLGECMDESIVISEGNIIRLYPEIADGIEFTICAEATEYSLSAEKKIVLYAPIPGDTDSDRKLTEKDVSYIADNYGKEADEISRLCDIDKNGFIDIIDLAYAARYMQINSEK